MKKSLIILCVLLSAGQVLAQSSSIKYKLLDYESSTKSYIYKITGKLTSDHISQNDYINFQNYYRNDIATKVIDREMICVSVEGEAIQLKRSSKYNKKNIMTISSVIECDDSFKNGLAKQLEKMFK